MEVIDVVMVPAPGRATAARPMRGGVGPGRTTVARARVAEQPLDEPADATAPTDRARDGVEERAPSSSSSSSSRRRSASVCLGTCCGGCVRCRRLTPASSAAGGVGWCRRSVEHRRRPHGSWRWRGIAAGDPLRAAIWRIDQEPCARGEQGPRGRPGPGGLPRPGTSGSGPADVLVRSRIRRRGCPRTGGRPGRRRIGPARVRRRGIDEDGRPVGPGRRSGGSRAATESGRPATAEANSFSRSGPGVFGSLTRWDLHRWARARAQAWVAAPRSTVSRANA